MARHLSKHNIVVSNQHGFREKLSTETQLIQALDDWSQSLHNGKQTDVLFLDFSKAFDKIPHNKLLYKLNYYGLRGKTNQWVSGFLKDRTQCVTVNGQCSEWRDVASGVPQGSVLGPALFLLYINDIADNVHSNMRLFADDSVIYRTVSNLHDQQSLQNDLSTVFKWAQDWDMSFNVKKCCHLSITRKIKGKFNTKYSVENESIPVVNSCKYLGLTITHNLSWNEHARNTKNKASRTLGLIRRNLGPCDPEVKTRAYEALVRPQVEYATAAWNPYTRRNIKLLEGVQRQAARFVSRDYRTDSSVTAMVNKLGWDTLENRRLMSQAVMFSKVRSNIVNIPMPAYVHLQTYTRTRRLHQMQYQHIYTRVDTFKYSFFPRIIPVWNILPVAAVSAETLDGFRKAAWPVIRAYQGCATAQ